MDKASDFGSEDCEFESRRGQNRFKPCERNASNFRIVCLHADGKTCFCSLRAFGPATACLQQITA